MDPVLHSFCCLPISLKSLTMRTHRGGQEKNITPLLRIPKKRLLVFYIYTWVNNTFLLLVWVLSDCYWIHSSNSKMSLLSRSYYRILFLEYLSIPSIQRDRQPGSGPSYLMISNVNLLLLLLIPTIINIIIIVIIYY